MNHCAAQPRNDSHLQIHTFKFRQEVYSFVLLFSYFLVLLFSESIER